MASRMLERWSPFADLDEMRARLDRLFGDLEGHDWGPAMDVIRGDGKLVLKVDLPGIKLDEVKVEVEDNVLKVSGEHEEKLEEEKEHFVRRERRYGSFYRTLPLPTGVKPEAIEAVCRDGVLEVTVPLPPPEKKTVTITPKAA